MAEIKEIEKIEWGKYDVVEAGCREKTTITEVHRGKVRDFVSEAYAREVEEEYLERDAIQIVCDNGLKTFFVLPDKKILPNSKLAKYKKTYGKLPECGDVVETEYNSRGYPELIMRA